MSPAPAMLRPRMLPLRKKAGEAVWVRLQGLEHCTLVPG